MPFKKDAQESFALNQYLLLARVTQARGAEIRMAIKDELAQDVKDEGGGQEELDALDSLEKEAAEFNKAS